MMFFSVEEMVGEKYIFNAFPVSGVDRMKKKCLYSLIGWKDLDLYHKGNFNVLYRER